MNEISDSPKGAVEVEFLLKRTSRKIVMQLFLGKQLASICVAIEYKSH